MNRTQRVEALKQVIAHTIKGERELAESLFKQVSTAAAREILVREANYSLDDDPEFDGRREMQRELEDDLESGSMEPGADEMGGCPECGTEPCECETAPEGGDADATIDAIVSKLEAGDVDDEVLAMILDMVNDETEEGGEGDELGGEGEPGLDPEADPAAGGEPAELGDEGEFDFDSLVKTESISGGAALMQKIKFALEYDYDQFLDSGGFESDWPSVALSNPSPELENLMAKIPEGQKGAYNSMIERIVHFQGGNSARLKDLI